MVHNNLTIIDLELLLVETLDVVAGTDLCIVWLDSPCFLQNVFDTGAFLGVNEQADGSRVLQESALQYAALLVNLPVKRRQCSHCATGCSLCIVSQLILLDCILGLR